MRKQTYPMLYWSYWDNITYEYSSQCYPNKSGTTLHKKITSVILAQSAQIYFRWKTGLMTCFLTGALSSNTLGSFYLMLAQQLIYGLCENNEQVPVLTGTLPINNYNPVSNNLDFIQFVTLVDSFNFIHRYLIQLSISEKEKTIVF